LSTVQRNFHRVSTADVRPQQALLFAPEYPGTAQSFEKKGVVYTKTWVVEFMLDLAGYTEGENLVDATAVEPAAGEGAFLISMAQRLIASCRRQGRPVTDCRDSLMAFELEDESAQIAQVAVVQALTHVEVPEDLARELARSWVRTGDYLFQALALPSADFVIGNPPYVRIEDIPDGVAGMYRGSYPTMMGRADLYVAFYEAGLRQLKTGGVCAFICADRWMLNQYGAELRNLVTSTYAVETIIEMHKADAFHDDVSAYPAITIIRRGPQKSAVVASAAPEAEVQGGAVLTAAIQDARTGKEPTVPGLITASVKTWFSGSDPWPCSSPKTIALLRRIEEQFEPLEAEDGLTKVGIGVATGLDDVFITADANLVEPSQLLPLALARDTQTGRLQWSGHYLVDPWNSQGLVDLSKYPRLKQYFEQYEKLLKKRHTAQKNTNGWYRTIDRVNHTLTATPKLYIPDIKDEFNPVLDRGETYPHHNLYFVQSSTWDLEVLGGILLSAVAQFFIESYGVRMRGGYLRFQAQYLRRIRVPNPYTISADAKARLIKAFTERDRRLATQVALELYNIDPTELERRLGHRRPITEGGAEFLDGPREEPRETKGKRKD
jgi:adenine-specific DNA-methyltransferase